MCQRYSHTSAGNLSRCRQMDIEVVEAYATLLHWSVLCKWLRPSWLKYLTVMFITATGKLSIAQILMEGWANHWKNRLKTGYARVYFSSIVWPYTSGVVMSVCSISPKPCHFVGVVPFYSLPHTHHAHTHTMHTHLAHGSNVPFSVCVGLMYWFGERVTHQCAMVVAGLHSFTVDKELHVKTSCLWIINSCVLLIKWISLSASRQIWSFTASYPCVVCWEYQRRVWQGVGSRSISLLELL